VTEPGLQKSERGGGISKENSPPSLFDTEKSALSISTDVLLEYPNRHRDCFPLQTQHDLFPCMIAASWALLSFRHGNRHCLASAAFRDPDRVARGLDCGWCLEAFLDYRDAGLIAIDSNH
jgi:hypothetical protein